MKLLIIDDQISVLKGIENGISFAEIGIDQVFTATSADRARDILLHNDIQLVLCDIEMPGENGLELNRWILKNMPHIVRILLSLRLTKIKKDCINMESFMNLINRKCQTA